MFSIRIYIYILIYLHNIIYMIKSMLLDIYHSQTCCFASSFNFSLPNCQELHTELSASKVRLQRLQSMDAQAKSKRSLTEPLGWHRKKNRGKPVKFLGTLEVIYFIYIKILQTRVGNKYENRVGAEFVRGGKGCPKEGKKRWLSQHFCDVQSPAELTISLNSLSCVNFFVNSTDLKK